MKKAVIGRRLKSPKSSPAWTGEPLKRVNFFTGQLLTADDFRAEQNYHLEKHRRHNRGCHGYGVVQGLEVSVAKAGSEWKVHVTPGCAMDAAGNEIQLCSEQVAQLGRPESPIHVLIRFRECLTDAVPLPGERRRAPDPPKAYARIREDCEVFVSPCADPATPEPDPTGTVRPWPALPLARLVSRGRCWHVDRKFKPPRVR